MKTCPWPRAPLFLPFLVTSLLVLAVACGSAATATLPPPPTQPPAAKAAPAPTAAAAAAVPRPAPSPTTAPPAAVTAKVKRLDIAITPPIHEIVLGWMGTTVDANLQVRHFAEPLVETNRKTGALEPSLATEWAMTKADGTQWTFKLRKGIPFRSSQKEWGEFTAKDVVHSIAMNVLPEAIGTDTGLFRGLFGKTVEDVYRNIETPDDYTVVFNLLRPEAELDFIATGQQGNWFIYSKAQFDAEGLKGYEKAAAGTGPWVFVDRQLGTSISYQRVKDHWRKTPEFEEFRLLRVPEAATRLAMMLSREAHISEVDRNLHQQAVGKGMKVVNSQLPSIQLSYVIGGVFQPYMETYDPKVPALDVRVREAINRAVNRKELNDTLFAGQGDPHQVWGYHPALAGWNPRWAEQFDAKYGYDPARARELLKEAGYPNGFKIKVIVTQLPGTPEMIDMAEALLGYLEAVGIKPEAEEMEWARFRSDFYVPAKTHNTIAPIRGTYRPPDINIRFYNLSGPEGFFRTIVDPAQEEKFKEVRKSVDREFRTRKLREIGDILFDGYSQVPLVWIAGQVVVDPSVVKEFIFPGNINGPISHIEYIKPVAK